jgi:L,D-transpeptidase catalytic domain
MPKSPLSRFPIRPLVLGLLAASLAVLVSSCGSTGSGDAYDGRGGTYYLGPDGIIVGPDGKKLQKKKGKQVQVARAVPLAPQWRWEGDGISGAPSIVIDLGDQMATFYKGSTAVGWSPISSGNEQYPTPTGSYRIQQKSAAHISNLYGDYVDEAGNVVVADIGVRTDRRPPGTRFKGASMPYFMRITGGVGMHAGYLPGYPASHGCIRMPRGAAEVFFRNVTVGTPVKVVY